MIRETKDAKKDLTVVWLDLAIVQTTLRPDIVLWSKTGKKLIVIELIVLWETICEEAYERKKAKYTELVDLY